MGLGNSDRFSGSMLNGFQGYGRLFRIMKSQTGLLRMRTTRLGFSTELKKKNEVDLYWIDSAFVRIGF